jgi:hypothetical protein
MSKPNVSIARCHLGMDAQRRLAIRDVQAPISICAPIPRAEEKVGQVWGEAVGAAGQRSAMVRYTDVSALERILKLCAQKGPSRSETARR